MMTYFDSPKFYTCYTLSMELFLIIFVWLVTMRFYKSKYKSLLKGQTLISCGRCDRLVYTEYPKVGYLCHICRYPQESHVSHSS
jgi:hypothetical protein